MFWRPWVGTPRLPPTPAPFFGVLVVLLYGAHIVNRKFAPLADPTILPVVAVLNGIGYVLIARLDPELAAKQAGWTALGVVGYVGALMVLRNLQVVRTYKWTLGLLGVVFLMLPIIRGLGIEVNGARIWIRVGSFTVQPGEFDKIALTLFFAGYLTENRELLRTAKRKIGPINLPEPKYLGPIVSAWALSLVVLIFERDLGSGLLFFTLFLW